METQRGTRVEFDLAEGGVLVQDVDDAELIEIEAHVRLKLGLENFRAQVDVFRADKRAHRRPLMPLLHLVPPAIDLVADHCRFFDKERARGQEREQRFFRAGNCGEKLPSREDADAAGGRHFDGHLFVVVRRRALDTLAVQAPVHGCEKALCYWSFGQRQQLGFIQTGLNERCVSGSNLRMVSISSPKNSMRTGRSDSGEYTSRIPPRRVN